MLCCFGRGKKEDDKDSDVKAIAGKGLSSDVEELQLDNEELKNTNEHANSFEELPEYLQSKVRKSGIDIESLSEGKNFTVLANVIRFTTKKTIVQAKGDKKFNDPLREEEADSTQVKRDINTEDEAISKALLKSTAESIMPLENPKKLFKNITFSGKGGFGQVYFAEQKKNRVAIKKMTHTSEKEVKANLTELAFLKDCVHPNIVSFMDAYTIGNEIWIVTEFLEGGTLSEAVRAFKFKETQVAFVAREILKALKYLHGRGYAHRDLKSGNVMMTVQGQIKLIDFGLCVDMSKGPIRHIVGSPNWIPCEMVRGKTHTLSCDMWSFAVCLMEMINGQPPKEETIIKTLYKMATVGLEDKVRSSQCSTECQDFLMQCLKMVPSQRATPEQLLQHPFLSKATTVESMEDIVKSVFINNQIMNGGIL